DIRHANSDAALRADPSLLDIILGNLLANASHYCPEGGTIRIDRSENALVISNPAPDLEADEVQMFGRRHWSKHYGTSGHIGLGLTLASAAARAMQLQLQFSVDAKQQLRANLQWPDTPAPAA
ncbi:MAG TPA: ATP-binding protein, partial [Rudaea sp.]|nr:ATP-binding protein [Rudaea sp.]